MNWLLKNIPAKIDLMSQNFKISKTFATVLANRNILTKRAMQTYIYVDDKLFLNTLEMKDIKKAFIIIKNAISKQEKICIYGDYDVDGVSSTVILYKALKKLGANVFYYIPDREEEGYGLNKDAIDEVKKMSTDIILTCDNGIVAIDEIDYIKSINMQIIVLDHHEPKFEPLENGENIEILPKADAIINPKQKACSYPFKAMCAAGISYKFISALYKYLNINDNLDEFLVFASIATVCDIVDLLDENRLIVKKGLNILNKNIKINKGLYQIILLNNLSEKALDEFDYGFKIGPCINASGRLESALKAVRLFTTDDEKEINTLAKGLLDLNNERKLLTEQAFLSTLNTLENSDLKNDKVLVIYNPNIHESIAGIVAGKLKEKLFKPTFVITKTKDGAKGSGRSIPCYNMFEELLKCENLFTKFGGHKMAAGLSLKEENIEIFKNLINKNCTLKKEDFIETIYIDKVLNFEEITLDLATELTLMKPIGKENKQALFATKNVAIDTLKIIGKNNNILKFIFKDKFNNKLNAISFDGYEKFLKITKLKDEDLLKNNSFDNINLDIVYSIEINEFNNYKNIQLLIKDFRLS